MISKNVGNSIENLQNDGTPPIERIADAQSARAILAQLQLDDQPSSQRRSEIQGIIDGNSPYSDQQLKELGQDERININWGHAEGKIENASIPYYDMLTSVPWYATIKTAYGKKQSQKDDWNRIISEEFHHLLQSDKSFLTQHQLIQRNLVIHGQACGYFRDARDWRSHSIAPWNLVVPRDADVSWTDWEFCFVLDEYYCEELYSYIRNEEAAVRNKWNVENCKNAIMSAEIDKQDKRRPWEWYQMELKNNGLYYSYSKSRVIKIAHLYVKGFDGRISHYIFDREQPGDWLRKSVGCYSGFDQAFTVFLNGVGNEKYHGVRGLGQKVHKYAEAMNRTNNALLEGVIISSSVMLQAGSAGDVSKLQTVNIGPYRILPPGLQFTQVNLASNLGGAMQVASYFQGQEADQTSSYLPTIDRSSGKKKGNKDLELEMGEKAKLTNSRAEIYMQALDLHYAEVYRRATNFNLVEEDHGGIAALKFQNACIKRGVPKAALRAVESVSATRSMGQGSSANRILAMQQISQFIPMLPEEKRIAVIRSSIAAIGGEQFVDAFAPEEDSKISGVDASIASLENNVFLSGVGQVVVDPNQNHYIHVTIHIRFFGEVVQAVKSQKFDPRKANQCFTIGGPHLLIHLKALSEDPTRKQQFEQLNRQTSELMKIADQIASMAQRMDEQEQEQAKQQQEQQQPEPQMLVAQNKMRLDSAKATQDLQIKRAKAEQQMKLKDVSTAQRLQITTLSHNQRMQQSQQAHAMSQED